KLIDAGAHRQYTGKDNALILSNLKCLSSTGVPFVVRVPLIPGITGSNENLSAIARTLRGLPGLLQVDLLPYNRAAGGKYAALGMTYQPGFDEAAKPNANTGPFLTLGIPAQVRLS
ncbi:MAG: glycyl-radical enzyme activating protein, partial [Bryobacteraceae bacterium]